MTTNQYVPALALIDRKTNMIIGKPAIIPEKEWPFDLPVGDTPLIRYLDYWKLERMIKGSQLFFCYADKLEDSLEGTYAEANRNFLTRAYKELLALNFGYDDRQRLFQQSDFMRKEVAINCWQILAKENRQMWSTFTKNSDSAAIVSTFSQLNSALPDIKGIGKGKVQYLAQTIPRVEWHSLAPFYAKDPQFEHEQEFRLTYHCDIQEPHVIEMPNGRGINISLHHLITKVILHPEASIETAAKIDKLFREVNLPVIIVPSEFKY